MPKTEALKIGDPAPTVTLPDQNNKPVSLSDLYGKKVVVLFFYPKDNTSVCTAEACSFRDQYSEFKDLGAEVIGISSDSASSHSQFAGKHQLPYKLLSDEKGAARKAFTVPNTMGIMPGRVTYVIDKSSKIRYIFNSQLDGPKHVSEAMKIVKELNNKT
ncbi:MAG: peroxiredoxin [Candidatus Obscuribacterales bacterium]|nr:peroxiredoxin [Candidatus Obscuribacterales bacterium]